MTNSLRIKLAEALGIHVERIKFGMYSERTHQVKLHRDHTPNAFRSYEDAVNFGLPDFTRYEAGAALLVEHLRKEGFHVTIYSVNRELEPWVCIFETLDTDTKWKAHADSLPAAIVAAACAVMNITVDTSAKG